MTTTEMLNTLRERADVDGLPDLVEVLACSAGVPEARTPLTVGEVAERLGVTGHTLRYYERIGLVEVARSSSGHRRYDAAALGRIVFITRLRMSGMSIHDIGAYLRLVEQGEATVDARLELLYAHRDKVRRQLDELHFAMAVIEYKITTYGGHCGS